MTMTKAVQLILAIVITLQAVSGLPLSQEKEIKVREIHNSLLVIM